MANVLSDEKKQQVLALGRLGWSLRKIEEATGVRRETAGAYLRAAGVAVRAPRQVVLSPKPASTSGVSTDLPAAKPRAVTPLEIVEIQNSLASEFSMRAPRVRATRAFARYANFSWE
jgi:hypothetical protein